MAVPRAGNPAYGGIFGGWKWQHLLLRLPCGRWCWCEAPASTKKTISAQRLSDSITKSPRPTMSRAHVPSSWFSAVNLAQSLLKPPVPSGSVLIFNVQEAGRYLAAIQTTRVSRAFVAAPTSTFTSFRPAQSFLNSSRVVIRTHLNCSEWYSSLTASVWNMDRLIEWYNISAEILTPTTSPKWHSCPPYSNVSKRKTPTAFMNSNLMKMIAFSRHSCVVVQLSICGIIQEGCLALMVAIFGPYYEELF